MAVGLTDIALMFELDTEADAATAQRLVEMTERLSIRYSEVARDGGEVEASVVDRWLRVQHRPARRTQRLDGVAGAKEIRGLR